MLPVNIIDRAAALKQEIVEKTEELRACNLAIAKNEASFKPGSKTGHAFGQQWKATVQLQETVSYDHEALEFLRFKIGDEKFFHLFRYEYKPKENKAIKNFIQFSEHGPWAAKAMITKEGAPQVKFERMEDSE